MEIEIPGIGSLRLDHAVMDFNGTIAVDGILLDGVAERLRRLSARCDVHVLTSDTQGTARRALSGLPLTLDIYDVEDAGACKRAYVEKLGAESCVCIGNGRNDVAMFEVAQLAIAILETEGAYAPILETADMVVRASVDALDLLLDDKRLISGLRR